MRSIYRESTHTKCKMIEAIRKMTHLLTFSRYDVFDKRPLLVYSGQFREQGRIHGRISRVRLGRSSDAKNCSKNAEKTNALPTN